MVKDLLSFITLVGEIPPARTFVESFSLQQKESVFWKPKTTIKHRNVVRDFMEYDYLKQK